MGANSGRKSKGKWKSPTFAFRKCCDHSSTSGITGLMFTRMRPGKAEALRRRITCALRMEEEDKNEEEVTIVLKDLQQVKKVMVLCRRKGSRRKKRDLSQDVNTYNGFRNAKKKRRGKENGFRHFSEPKGWFTLWHKHKHKPTYAEAVRCR